jgi:tRNA dimethylallyltransferase
VTVTHLALVGPTASGKSALALAAAHALGDVEIVSVDSMQVYRGLDIGTAKPTDAERAAIPHHLIDVADPSDGWSVAQFQAEARAAVADITSRRRRALLVGGTGLYVQAVVDDLRFPEEDLTLRAELEAWTAEPGGVAAAYAELVAVDPDTASRTDPHNARRIVRALEVTRLTGKPFSSFGPGINTFGSTAFPVTLCGMWLPRPVASVRIAARVDAMREAGFTDEVRKLRDSGPLSRTAAQAIGYRELLAVLDRALTEADAYQLIVRRTRAFARRQRMWFRRDPRIRWFGTAENPADLLPALLATWSR